ncbi:DNA damage repair (Rad9) [Cordyceps militaris]|uniref:DNA damage repair (Rad9) n=1 Tax=Cordyceps militaris TaxID=73501 RepID=A0A2H4SF82_CORMI|nr:DNA damage repair (Rad9) [Cordyceps militaris]
MASQSMISTVRDTEESQDSQLILATLRAELGVPLVSTSPIAAQLYLTCSDNNRHRSGGHAPIPSEPARPKEKHSQTPEHLPPTYRSFTIPAPPPPPKSKPQWPAHFVKQESIESRPKLSLMQGLDHPNNAPGTQIPDTLLPDTFLPPATQAIGHGGDDVPSAHSSLHSAAGPRKDTSQQTPTQVNDGRDYDTGYEPPSSERGVDTGDTQASNLEGQTLQDDDTGAVNLGILIDFPRQSSQVSEDGGFENARGGWRLPDDTQQNSIQTETPYKNGNLPPPETPALPKNPFAPKGGPGTFGAAPAPLGGTQLFGQTQLLTSAVKNSPTSSRPSPNVYNSISPGFAETSPLKNRTNISSPTDMRSSSPPRLHEVPATVIKGPRMSIITEETPTTSRASREDRIPESPTRPRSRERQPLAHYEPMQQSQARKTGSDSVGIALSFDGDTHDTVEQLERRRRIERKRARAGEELEKITLARPVRISDRAEANGKRRRLERNSQSVGLADEKALTGSAPAALRGTQPQSLESTKATPGEETDTAEITVDERADAGAQHQGVNDIAEYDMIPATSPVQLTPADDVNRIGSPASEPDLPILREEQSTLSSAEPSSLPPLNSRRRTYGRQAVRRRKNLVLDSSYPHSASTGIVSSKYDTGETRPPNDDPIHSDEGQTPMATRSGSKKQSPKTPMLLSGDEASTTSSSLSVSSRTPNPPPKTTPATDESLASKALDVDTGHSLTPSRSLRRRVIGKESATPLPLLSSRSLRASKRLHGEPHSSGQPRTPSDTGAATTFVQRICQNVEAVHREERRLFEGMVFAISVAADRGKLESRIVQAGGSVLQDGFQELFQSLPSMTSTDGAVDDKTDLILSQPGLESGFAALIADGHSRKAKYMQALALGLPCLAQQWIFACLHKGALIDWQPYLLCAGASAVLGNASRSRYLLPYPADTAVLADTIEQRPRLLHGQSVLVVMDGKKARSEAKQPYMFLCQALGPAITRVATVDQGRAALAQSVKSGGRPFTWLYIDKATGTADAVLATPSSARSKRKKKRTTPVATQAGAGVRILHDELIIQSLILGRIVEPEEEDSF